MNVFLVANCISSRTNQQRDLTWVRFRQTGCFITINEAIICNILRDKEHPKLKDMADMAMESSARNPIK